MAPTASRPPSTRALTTLVQSTNPSTTRVSRSDDPARAKDKEETLEDLLEASRKTLAAHRRDSPSSSTDITRVLDRIRRRLARLPEGRLAVSHFDSLITRLEELTNPPSDLPAILQCLSLLSSTAPSSSRQTLPVLDYQARRGSLSDYNSNAVPSAVSYRRGSLSREPSNQGGRRPSIVGLTEPPRRASRAGSLDVGPVSSSGIEQQVASIDLNCRATAAQAASRAQDVEPERQKAERDDDRREVLNSASDPQAPINNADNNDQSQSKSEQTKSPTPHIDPAELGLGVVPRSVVLERWRQAANKPVVPERELLRDMLFMIQGINGRRVRFEQLSTRPIHDPGVIQAKTDNDPSVVISVKIDDDGHAKISSPTRHLIHRLAEAGKHYQRVTSFIRTQAIKEQTGRIMQSLCRFLDAELEDYYELICQLEEAFNEGSPQSKSAERVAPPSSRSHRELSTDEIKGLTLKRLFVLIEPSLLRLRLMSSLVEGAQHTHGGALVSLIHNYTFNGDPLIREFTDRLLDEVSRSFFTSLGKWIYEGELSDPFKEFFVELNPEAAGGSYPRLDKTVGLDIDSAPDEVDAAAIWENKFLFRSELVPTFLPETFARKIFSAGKSLNFIRYSCGTSDWDEARKVVADTAAVESPDSKASSERNASPTLKYRNLVGLEKTIDAVHSTISKRLLDIFLDKFKLQDHLRAINEYLMLTRGDFADVLMESLSPILHKQASMLYRHSLSGALETAIRGSNAQFDDVDILRRLDARVLEFTGSETGWDTFTLEYRVDSPVNTVLDAGAMAEYQQIFQHLWRMKRVEGSLSASCVKLMGASNALNKAAFNGVKGRKRREVEKDEDIEALRHESHRSLLVLSAMTHFIRQLQGYNQLEVISYSWQDLETFFEKRHGDLDVLIAAHRGYLSSLHGKVLLRGGGAGSKQRGAVDYLASELRASFDSILRFSSAVDQLATFILDFLERRTLLTAEQDATDDSRAEADDAVTTRRLSAVLRALSDASADFNDRTDAIISRLERHGNLVIRDLSVRLDFNGFYSRTRPDRSAPTPVAASARSTGVSNQGDRAG